MAADDAFVLVAAVAFTFNFSPAGLDHYPVVPCSSRANLCTMPRHVVTAETSFLHQHPCHSMFGPAWPRRAIRDACVLHHLHCHPSPRVHDATFAPRLPCKPTDTAHICSCTAVQMGVGRVGGREA